MIELLFIFLSIFLFVTLFSYPLNIFNYKNFFFVKIKFFDLILFNVAIHLFILLFFSIFLSNFFIIFIVDLLFSLIFLIFYFKKYLIYFKKNFFIFFFFIILSFSYFVSIAYYPILSWDGAVHWVYKALNFYQGMTYENLKNVPINYYPHLGGFMWFYFWENSILELEYFGRFLQPFLILVTFFSLIDHLSNNFKLIEKFFLILIFTYICKDNFLFGGYQDYLIFVLFYIFSRLFLLIKSNNNLSNKKLMSFFILIVSFLFLWVKQEGFFYFFILNIIFLFHTNFKNNFKFFYFIIFLSLFLFFIFTKIYYFENLTFSEPILRNDLLNNFYPEIFFQKFLVISKYLIISFIKYPIWIIIIIMSILIHYKIKYFDKNKFYLTYFSLIFLFFYLIYFQTGADLTYLLSVTLSRLVFHSSGFLLPILVDYLNIMKRQK
jgi:hypothetical protein